MMTSSTSSGFTPARSSAAWMAMVPSACADMEAKAPLKLPTGVRAAEAMTISVKTGSPTLMLRRTLDRRRHLLQAQGAGQRLDPGQEGTPELRLRPTPGHHADMAGRGVVNMGAGHGRRQGQGRTGRDDAVAGRDRQEGRQPQRLRRH